MKFNIRLFYLYLFSFIGLVVSVIGSIRLVDLGLKVFIFKDADRYDYPMAVSKETGEELITKEEEARGEVMIVRQRQREFTGATSMIMIGLPLYFYHWKTIQKEKDLV